MARTQRTNSTTATPGKALSIARSEPTFTVRFCIPDDQLKELPQGQHVPQTLPKGALVPRVGDVVYLTSTSAWGVSMVIHEMLPGCDVRIEVARTHRGFPVSHAAGIR